TISTIASEFGVTVEPTTTSTLSSLMSLRVFVTARVVSEASSRMIHRIFSPPIDVGSIWNVFLSGMPSEAAGPVADNVTPAVTSANESGAKASPSPRTKKVLRRERGMNSPKRRGEGTTRAKPADYGDRQAVGSRAVVRGARQARTASGRKRD